MDLKAYIESGILELYALGLLTEAETAALEKLLPLHGELSEELERICIALEKYALSNALKPKPELKNTILNTIENLQKEKIMDLENLPLIDRYADYKNWLKVVAQFGALTLGDDGRAVKVLRQDEKVTQVLIISTTNIEQEVHINEQESFLILSGTCKCTVGDQVRFMGEGDYMSIPLYEPHDVQLVSPRVTAILQHVKI